MIKKSEWKTREKPVLYERLKIIKVITDAEASKLLNGFKPKNMEDKWFIYSEDGWVNFHRSWTGFLVYWFKLEGCSTGVSIIDAYVNKDKEQYNSIDTQTDIKILEHLINAYGG